MWCWANSRMLCIKKVFFIWTHLKSLLKMLKEPLALDLLAMVITNVHLIWSMRMTHVTLLLCSH
uniref:Uncharacterized protein n=1 Tax=Arundo donax TaxID=35708 RepID=A0A0A9G0P3_ARUDO